MRRAESDTPVHPRVEVAFAGTHADVEIAEPTESRVEDGYPPLDHAAVEHERGIGDSLIGYHPLDDGLSADLLLRVQREAEVDRKLPGVR